jgi:hypothetical protein
MLWKFLNLKDKGVTRTTLLAIVIHFSSLCLVDILYAILNGVSYLWDAKVWFCKALWFVSIRPCSSVANSHELFAASIVGTDNYDPSRTNIGRLSLLLESHGNSYVGAEEISLVQRYYRKHEYYLRWRLV